METGWRVGEQVNAALRREVRVSLGREPEPSAAIVDTAIWMDLAYPSHAHVPLSYQGIAGVCWYYPLHLQGAYDAPLVCPAHAGDGREADRETASSCSTATS